MRLATALVALAAIGLLSGCTTSRLSSAFNGYVTGSPPAATPQPTPPADFFLWTGTQVSTIVVKRSGRGRFDGWAHIVPNRAYLADPDLRRPALYAYSEPLTTAPPANLQGSATLRLDGYGRVFLGLQAVNNPNNAPGSFLGGILIDVPPLAPSSGVVAAVNWFQLARIADTHPLGTVGTIQPYQPGSTVTVHWSIDQATRKLMLRSDTPGAVAQFVEYPASSDDRTNVPIAKILVSIWLQTVGPATGVFLDDLLVEELN